MPDPQRKPDLWLPGFDRDDPQADGLVAAWTMQEEFGPLTYNAADPDKHVATLVNGPTRVMTPMGRGIYCVKTDVSYIATPVLINPTLPGSFFFWVRWVAVSGKQLSGWHSLTTYNRLFVGINSTNAYVRCGDGTSSIVPHGMTADNWYCIGLTWDGSLAEHWVDEKKIVGFSYTAAASPPLPLHIGKPNGLDGYESTATFTAATVHSRVLAPAEIRKLAGLDGDDPWSMIRPPDNLAVLGSVPRIVLGPYCVERRHVHVAGGELHDVHTAGGRRRHIHTAGGALHATRN